MSQRQDAGGSSFPDSLKADLIRYIGTDTPTAGDIADAAERLADLADASPPLPLLRWGGHHREPREAFAVTLLRAAKLANIIDPERVVLNELCRPLLETVVSGIIWTKSGMGTGVGGATSSGLRSLAARLRRSAAPLPAAAEPSVHPDDLVSTNQVAAICNVSTKTILRAFEDNKLPIPDAMGGGGKPHRWRWSIIRPALIQHFRADLPERFPGSQFIGSAV